ncbi:receptor-type tyrosine-protein phosphatase S-like isoform X2 [Dysidea avara]|uniref:receptor-type tyrosine-protein phosphatase S-like isoform X2 n=1 Tax=Dysidea avara TaxID=196820 RepID=UPI00332CE8EA
MAVVTAVFTFLCAVVLQVGGLTCIDVVDNVQQNGNEIISPGRTVIVPRLNFTCNGEITNIRVRVSNRTSGTNFPYIQLWRESSTPQLYNLVGQVQIQSSHISSTGLTHQEANIVLTSIDRIQFLSGDVIGFYNPSDTGYVIDDIQTDGYVYYVFVGSSASSQNLNNGFTSNRRQPLIQFTIEPGPPRDITLIEADPAMLSVRYRSPEPILRNGDVTGYVIRYTRVGSGVSQMITVDGSSNRFRRDDLPEVEVYTRYSVQLATVNVNGTGSFSDPVMGLSGQDKPTTAPLSLTADTIQSRFVILSWREPATPNGVIVQYEVQYSVNTTASLVNFTDTLMDTVEGLSPGTIYTLQIRAYTRVGAGPFSVGISVTTLLEPPAPVPGVMVPVISSSMLTIYWMEPNVPNGMIVRYTVFYLPVSGPYGPIIISNRRKRQLPQDGEFSVDFTGTSGTLTNLNGSVTYRIQVSAIALHNGTELLGNRSTAEMIATSEGTPTEPHDIVATNVTQSSIFLTWQRPDPPNGLITNYTVSYNAMVTYFNQNTSLMETFTMNNSTSVEPNDDSISASLIFSDLRLGTEYQFTIVAYTNVGPGPEAIMSVSTLPDAPPIPKQPQLPTDAGATTIEITIQRASDFNGPIMYYAVIVVINGDENSTANEKDVGPYNNEGANFAISNSELYTYITGIVETSDISDHPYPYIVGDGMRSSIGGESYVNVQLQSNAMYAILVRAYTTDDLFSTSSSLSVSTASSGGSGDGGGSPGIIIGVIVAISIVAVIVIIIIFVVIYMRRRNGGSAFSGKKSYMEDSSVVALKDMTDHGKSAGSFEPEIIGLPKDLVATEGQSYTFPYHVTGKPAPDVYWYLNSKDMTENDDVVISSNGQLTLTVVRTDHEGEWRCQATSSSGSSEARTNLTVKSTKAKPLPSPRPVHRHKPIPTGEFGVYVNMLHENSNQGFKDEYESFYNGKDMSTAVGSASSNNFKNRFANIVAYDNNRVALVPCGEYKDDYVNASPVDGYQHPKYFIAAQAPVNKTLADFWRLIWQEHPPTIVMVTNLKEGEKVKCVQYWPNAVGESLTFGPLRVQLSEEFEFADYVVRTIELKNAEQRNHLRVVTQYHFTAWPDHGVPEYATAMLAFHRRVRANHHSSIGPMMVHCSAGVGRTGTFITIDIALEQVKAEGVVDIYNIVNKLRHQRPHMVQALEQYMFMHDGILESITCGNTQVSAPDLQRMVAKLKQRDPHTNLTGYEQQFKVLEQVSPRVEEQVSNSALRNPDKNRPNHCPPMEKGRVILRKEKPDYINAAFLKGYKQDKAFIVAQSPMQNTVRDFWKMMMDRQCACVVMLCELEEGGQEACAPYWPDTGSFTYGDIVVANISVVEAKEFTTGVFKVTDKKSNVTHQVTQFHMHSWGAHKSPASNAGILAMIEEIQKVQRGTGNKPIVVHCSNVLGRTGTFCVLFTILDRFKVEQVVDVLQTVKLLRIKRPGIVEDLDQYQFIYSTVLRYLQSFDTYDNFKI